MPGIGYDLTVRTVSPLWRWSSISNDSTRGWTFLCDQQVPGAVRCDPHTAQYTTAAATANLTFYGSDVSIYGNYTGGMNYAMTLDGGSIQTGNATGPGNSRLLASWSGLSIKVPHVVAVQTIPGSHPNPAFTIQHADLYVDTGLPGNISNTYMDELDDQIHWTGSNFTSLPEFPGTILPPGIVDSTYRASQNAGDNFSFSFNASSVVVYGPCYDATGGYSVAFDSEAAVDFNASTPLGNNHVAENCVLYERNGIDVTEEHSLTFTGTDPGRWMGLDWIQLIQVVNGTDFEVPSPLVSGHNSANIGAIAGGVIAAAVVILGLISGLWWVLRRRRRRREFMAEEPLSDEMEVKAPSNTVAWVSSSSHAFPPLYFDQDYGALGSRPPSRTTATISDSPSIFTAAGPSPSDSYGPLLPLAVVNTSPLPSPLSDQTTFPSTPYPPIPESTTPMPARRDYDPDGKLEEPLTPSSNIAPSLPMASTGQYHALRHSHSLASSSNSVAVTLTQVSQDVNRILTQLGQLRITPGEVIDEEHPVMDDILLTPVSGGPGGRPGVATMAGEGDDGPEPPEYDENDGTIPPEFHPLSPPGL